MRPQGDRQAAIESRDRFDVAVVGAGPAGTSAALRLARAGLAVVVVDKAKPPRYKTCGGGLVPRAYRLLGLELAGSIERKCGADLHFLDAGLSFSVDLEDSMVTMTMRADLDQLLLEKAVEAGASLRAPWELQRLERRADGLVLHSRQGSLAAGYVIAADGAGGPTAGLAGWKERPRMAPAIESEISVDPATLERFSRRARFDLDAVPYGYSWVFPKREHLSVGCLSLRPRQLGLRRALDGYLARIGITPQRRDDHGFAIPFEPRSRRLARGRVLLTGDAAGLADPVTYEGISNAVLSAQLAADAVAHHHRRPDRVRRAYEGALRSEILSELRLARLVAYGLYGFPRLRQALFRRAGDSICRALGQVFTGRATYRGLLGRPANYVKLFRRLLSTG